ncbi:protein mono-ADP-ribosyltransferase PARP14-like isoform X1 [Biomphalaria glabrata]|uniref:Poly [ADP-ribose] polymerase n=1 Tax=Biomphalaria glabrata TaxID=6526 RepID=A0A9W2ZU01_BIOGL|nr:protein mono-ADP-ribosyltransferase PARP14-like isoform X1 [Biomphalaria glabrata]
MSSVKTYLDNKELSGGGQIKCMQEIKEDKQVIVYFEPDVDVEDILFKKQEIEIDGAKLFISKYFPSLSKRDCNNEVKSEAKDGFITGNLLTTSDTENVQKLVEDESKDTVIKDIPDQSDWTEILSRIRSRSANAFRLNIRSFGIYEFLQGADGQKLIEAIQDKHECIVKVVPISEKNLCVGGPITEGLHHNTFCKGGSNKTENDWKIGRLKVNLIKGEIEKQTSDIIVITVNRTLDLNVGALAQVILSQAGVKVQKELKLRYANGIKFYEFAETSGGNLQAKYIFHACVPTYSQGADHKMTDLVRNMLARADILQAKSISFPTLGTGNLKCPLDIFSKVMLEAIIQHSKLKSNALKQIQMVVFPSHLNAAEAVHAVFSTGFMEASSELKGNVYKYGDVFLKIKHGDITEQDTDVIVTSIKDSMNLASSGGVCSLLLKKCGKKLQDECNAKKKDLDSKDVTVTSAPNLSCQHIIFMNKDAFAPRLAQGIFKVLIEAEKLGATSLALPALGAGFHKKQITSIKQCIFQAVEEFGKLPTQNLRKIKLVILNAAILDDFLDHEGSHPHLYNKETTDTTMLPENISQEVNVDFHSLIAQNKKKAANELRDACKLAYKIEKEIESNLHLLSSMQIKELLDLCSKHLILVKMNVKRGFLEMESFHPNGMLEVKRRLKKMIEVASKRSNNISVQWQYKQDDKNWFDFEPLLNSEMERMYQQKVTTCLLQDTNGCVYEIHFPRMIATCQTVSPIRRIDRSQAKELWPKHWEPMSKADNLKVVEVKPGTDEYNEVEKQFHSTLSGSPVKKLERIQNKSLYLQFCVKKKELDQYNPQNHQNEQKLFHGTMSDCIPPINENGFNRNYCGVNGTVYGSGVYFADKSSYSINYTKSDSDGNRHMYRARVLTGEFIETNSSTKYLPKKPGTNRPYDSGGDKSRGIYAIFHDSQVYPEYLITF